MFVAKKLAKNKYSLTYFTDEDQEVYSLHNIDGVALYDFLRGRTEEEVEWAMDIIEHSNMPVTILDTGEVIANEDTKFH